MAQNWAACIRGSQDWYLCIALLDISGDTRSGGRQGRVPLCGTVCFIVEARIYAATRPAKEAHTRVVADKSLNLADSDLMKH